MDVAVLIAFLQPFELQTSGTADTVSLTQTTLGKGQPYLKTAVNTVIEQTRSSTSLSLRFFSPPLPFSCLLMMRVAFSAGSCESASVGLWDGIRRILLCCVCRIPPSSSLLFYPCSLLSLCIYPSITEKIHGLTGLSKRV